jgi:hypothetical protein
MQSFKNNRSARFNDLHHDFLPSDRDSAISSPAVAQATRSFKQCRRADERQPISGLGEVNLPGLDQAINRPRADTGHLYRVFDRY